jgi:acyl-CoA-binding protein
MEQQLSFDNAVLDVVKLAVSPSNDEKLQIYGLYKQATIGNTNIPAPSFFDFAGTAKWKAWNSMNGKSSDDAKKEYVDLVKMLTEKYGQKIETQTV